MTKLMTVLVAALVMSTSHLLIETAQAVQSIKTETSTHIQMEKMEPGQSLEFERGFSECQEQF